MADTTTAKYTEAQSYFESTSRTKTGALPGCLCFSFQNSTSAARIEEYLDTGFWTAVIAAGSEITQTVGSGTMESYLIAHPNVPLVIRSGRLWVAFTNYSTSLPGSCVQADGSHVGTGATCAGLSAEGFPTNMVSNTAYSFYNGGTSRSAAFVNGTTILVPLLDETLDFWGDYEDYIWDHRDLVYGGNIVSLLDARIVSNNLKGVLVDWEDFIAVYDDNSTSWTPSDASGNLTSAALYDADNRFDPVAAKLDPQVLLHNNVVKMLCRRAEKLYANASWMANNDESTLYDLTQYTAGWPALTYTTPFTYTSFGRRKTEIQVYNAYGSYNSLTDCLYLLGLDVTRALRANIHCFNFWFACNTTPATFSGSTLSQRDDPTAYLGDTATSGANYLNIDQTMALVKCAMAMGSLRVCFYNEATSVTHPWWSIIAAYDEMQQYADIIKNGSNFVPPVGISRAHIGATGSTTSTDLTPFYSVDYSNASIASTIFICCRYYGKSMLFFGCTTNGATTTVNVRGPDNTSVAVSCTGSGSITVVN